MGMNPVRTVSHKINRPPRVRYLIGHLGVGLVTVIFFILLPPDRLNLYRRCLRKYPPLVQVPDSL